MGGLDFIIIIPFFLLQHLTKKGRYKIAQELITSNETAIPILLRLTWWTLEVVWHHLSEVAPGRKLPLLNHLLVVFHDQLHLRVRYNILICVPLVEVILAPSMIHINILINLTFQSDDVLMENWLMRRPQDMNWSELNRTDFIVLGKEELLVIVGEDVSLIRSAWDSIWTIIEMSVKESLKTRKIICSIYDLVVVCPSLKLFVWKVNSIT